MKELLLIGAEDGLVNQRMQDYAFKLGYKWGGNSTEYVEFDLDGQIADGEEIKDKRAAIRCNKDGYMTYSEAGYYLEHCNGKYAGIEIIDYVELEKRRANLMETE